MPNIDCPCSEFTLTFVFMYKMLGINWLLLQHCLDIPCQIMQYLTVIIYCCCIHRVMQYSHFEPTLQLLTTSQQSIHSENLLHNI